MPNTPTVGSGLENRGLKRSAGSTPVFGATPSFDGKRISKPVVRQDSDPELTGPMLAKSDMYAVEPCEAK